MDNDDALQRLRDALQALEESFHLQRAMRWQMSYHLALRHILTFDMSNPTLRVDQCSLYAAMNGVLVSPVQIYSLN